MRQTWLRSEAHVRLCVAQGPHVGETGLTTVRLSREAVPWLDPEAHTSDAEARSLDGLHPRQTNNTEKLRARNQFLRAKVYAMLLLMCKAPEDFSLMLDDDTAVNVTGLREWLRTRAMATPADRFMLYGGHVNEHRTPTGTFRFVGGGAGILFSRAARGRLCTKPCLITCLAHMLGMIKADREAMGGDQMLGKCARDCQLPPTSIPGFGRHPLWVARGGRSTANAMITTHHTRPTNRTNSMEADPRCRVLHVPERSGTRAVDSGVMDYICARGLRSHRRAQEWHDEPLRIPVTEPRHRRAKAEGAARLPTCRGAEPVYGQQLLSSQVLDCSRLPTCRSARFPHHGRGVARLLLPSGRRALFSAFGVPPGDPSPPPPRGTLALRIPEPCGPSQRGRWPDSHRPHTHYRHTALGAPSHRAMRAEWR